jgi:hypothetical protein
MFTMLSGPSGASFITIYSRAFEGCNNLRQINLYPKRVVSLQSVEAFTAIPSIYVHPNMYQEYTLSPEWARFSSAIFPLPDVVMEVDEEGEENEVE